jgi:flavin-dependent dehydrogenase
MAEFFDIVMVGGGPAGSTAGALLAKQGWDVAIFEKGNFLVSKSENPSCPAASAPLNAWGLASSAKVSYF